jgi:hypothetical protein
MESTSKVRPGKNKRPRPHPEAVPPSSSSDGPTTEARPGEDAAKTSGWGDSASGSAESGISADKASSKRSKKHKKKETPPGSIGGVSKPFVSAELPGGSRDRVELRGMTDPATQTAWLADRVDRLLRPPRGRGGSTGSEGETHESTRAAALLASKHSLVQEPSWPEPWLLKALGASRQGEQDWLDLATCSICSASDAAAVASAAATGAASPWSLHSNATTAFRDRALSALIAQAAVSEHARRAPPAPATPSSSSSSASAPASGKVAPAQEASTALRAALPMAWQHPGATSVVSNCLRVLVVSSSARRCTDVLRALQPLNCRAAKLWAKHMKPAEQLADLAGDANTLRKKAVTDDGSADSSSGWRGGRGGWRGGRGRARGGGSAGGGGGRGSRWRDGTNKRPPPSLAVGTPGRLLELAARGAFGIAAAVAACPIVTGKPADPAMLVGNVGSLGAPPMCIVVDLAGDGKGFTTLTPGQAGIGDAAAQLLLALCAPTDEAVETARSAKAFRPSAEAADDAGTAAASASATVKVDVWSRPRVLLI